MSVAFYLKLDGINGECVEKGHPNEIKIQTFHWPTLNKISYSGNGGMGAGKVDVGEIVITKQVDASTQGLFKAVCSGIHIKTGVISAAKVTGADSGQDFLTISLTNVMVSERTLDFSGEFPMETLSLGFLIAKVDYKKQSADGTLQSIGIVTYDRSKATVS